MVPKFTIIYNTITKEKKGFLGKAWEFFSDHQLAIERKDELLREGKFPTLRPWHCSDINHLNASDRYWIEKTKQENVVS